MLKGVLCICITLISAFTAGHYYQDNAQNLTGLLFLCLFVGSVSLFRGALFFYDAGRYATIPQENGTGMIPGVYYKVLCSTHVHEKEYAIVFMDKFKKIVSRRVPLEPKKFVMRDALGNFSALEICDAYKEEE